MSAFDIEEQMEIVWAALGKYRDALIPEGIIDHDNAWDEICTAMAVIAEDLNLDSSSEK